METPDRVILTGFMATGKSVTGRLLAALLGWDWVDTDAEIETLHGPIPEIFTTHGEPYFRELERRLASELVQRSNVVISTGGGMMLDSAVHRTLAQGSRVFCLTASTKTILRRVGGRTGLDSRPLLASNDSERSVRDLLAARAAGYAQFEEIDTNGASPDEVAARIATVLSDPPPGASE